MRIVKSALPAIGAAFLAACSTAPTAPTLPDVPSVGMANNAGGTYTIVTNGDTFTMTGTQSNTGGNLTKWYGAAASSTMKGAGYETADVLALAAMNKAGPNETYAGITGTLGTVPTSGTASYAGQTGFVLLEPTNTADPAHVYVLGGLNIGVDFGALTLSGSAGFNTSLQGDIVGNEFTGTFSTKGAVNSTVTTVPMQGGFYGTGGGTIAGAFAGTGLAGVFGGSKVP